MKIIIFVVSFLIQIVAAICGGFFLLLGLNGFNSKQSDPSIYSYLALSIVSAIGLGATSIFVEQRLENTSLGKIRRDINRDSHVCHHRSSHSNHRILRCSFSGRCCEEQMNEQNERIKTYQEFWDFYVQEHSQPVTRYLHFTGTIFGLVLFVWILRSGNLIYLPLCLVIGYAFAWFSHFFVEHNKPATFKYPLWSFISDYKMVWYMLTGRMDSEVQRVSNK